MISQIKSNLTRLLSLAALCTALTVSAEEENVLKAQITPTTSEIGVRYSNLTGYGASYQHALPGENAVRGTVWCKYYDYAKDAPDKMDYVHHSDNTYNFGLDLQHNIIHENRYRVFGMIGGGYAVRQSLTENFQTPKDTAGTDRQLITGGLGGGIEYFFASHVSADLGLCYKFDYDYNANSLETTKETGLGTSIGLNLCF